MLTTSRKFKRRYGIRAGSALNFRQLGWINDGFKCFMLFVTIICLCLKVSSYVPIEKSLNGIVIGPDLVNLPLKLCCAWTATRDLKQRKFNYPINYRYGINLYVDRTPLHLVLLLALF